MSRQALVNPDPGATPERRLSPHEWRAWRGFLATHAEVVRQLDTDLVEEHGLSAPAYEALLFLHRAPERRMRMGDLASEVLFTPSGISRLVERLERQGLVRRTGGSHDGRERFAELTDAGAERLRSAAKTHVAGVRRLFLERFSRDELDLLGDFWDRVGRS